MDPTGPAPPASSRPAWSGEAVELRPLGIGEVLDVAIKIWRRHFGTLVRATVVLVGPVQLLSALIMASLRSNADNLAAPGQTPDAGDFSAFIAGFLAIGVATYLVGLLATAANLKAVSEGYLGGTPNWRSSLRFAFDQFGSLLWLAVSTTFLVVLGLLGCILPGVYLWVAWAFATPVLLLEGLRGREARRRSRQLVRERWWPVFGALVLAVVLNQVVSTAISAPAAALTFTSHGDSLGAFFVRAVAATVSTVITTPFFSAVVAVIYFDLRVRKEGFDLELLAQRVGVEPVAGHETMARFQPPAPPTDPPFRPPPPPGWQPGAGGSGPPPA